MADRIIQSLLDTDLYKLSMQNAVLKHRQNVPVEYVFNNRRPEAKFNDDFANAFQYHLDEMRGLRMNLDQLHWFRSELSWLGEDYIQYLMNYRFDPSEVQWRVVDQELQLRIRGLWERTILWEVPLMALISELYFRHCDKVWLFDSQEQIDKLNAKGTALNGLNFTDFGTRRRRSYNTQDLVVNLLREYPMFTGTSNVHLAHKYSIKPLGTMAHEWIMGISALEGLRHANRHAMRIWQEVYKGNLGTALTDTFGSDVFFADFDGSLARLFDGVRHDSGCPFEYTDKVIRHYKSLRIDPTTKTIIFSDGLNVETAVAIAKHIGNRIRFSFGIGTNFTNDFGDSKPLNMVIKLSKCNDVCVVKLSDTPSKSIGDSDALRVARWTFNNTPLDSWVP